MKCIYCNSELPNEAIFAPNAHTRLRVKIVKNLL